MLPNDMISTGCSARSQTDLREAAFFRDTMRLTPDQGDGGPIRYEGLRALFKKHNNLAKEPQAFDVVSK